METQEEETEGPSGRSSQAGVQHPRVRLGWGGLTWVVPAAARGRASPPVPIHLGEFPLLIGVTGECVRGQVADLQAGIVSQEVAERHPAKARMRDPGYQRMHWQAWTFHPRPD